MVSGGRCFKALSLGLVGVGSIRKGSVGVKVLPVIVEFRRGQGHNFTTLV